LAEKKTYPFLLFVGHEKDSFLFRSRLINGSAAVISADDAIDFLKQNAHILQGAVIIACSDALSSAIDSNIDSLSCFYKVPGSSFEGLITSLMDKSVMSDLAEKVGLKIPESWTVTNIGDINDVKYPCITKPILSKDGSKADISVCTNREELESVITSGSSKYNIFASEISVTTTSGCVEVKNCTDRKANKISLDSVSGSHTISGFKCNEFKFNSVSGCIKAEGISGRGNADVVSGEMIIEYAEWDNNLKLNAVSGEFDITLPEDSGVEIDLDALSGEVEVELKEDEDDIDKSTFSGESNSGELGGDNVHEVKVDLVSGDVSIHN
jgi:hypothetical protein